MFSYCFIFVVSCLVLANAGNKFKPKHLPSYVTACSRSSPDLNACALEHGRKALPTVLKGDKEYKVPVLSPMHLDRVEIKPSDTFVLLLTNITIYGFENLDIQDINIDVQKKHVVVELAGAGMKLISNYKVNGQLLVLTISGEGYSEFSLDKCNFKYSMDYSLTKKSDGKEYVVVKESNVLAKINKAHFFLDNLFNGNKELSDNMNKVLNENYEAVLDDLGETISKVISTVVTSVIQAIFDVIPYDEILLP